MLVKLILILLTLILTSTPIKKDTLRDIKQLMITYRTITRIRREVLLYRVGDDRRLVNWLRVTPGERTKSLRHSRDRARIKLST